METLFAQVIDRLKATAGLHETALDADDDKNAHFHYAGKLEGIREICHIIGIPEVLQAHHIAKARADTQADIARQKAEQNHSETLTFAPACVSCPVRAAHPDPNKAEGYCADAAFNGQCACANKGQQALRHTTLQH